MGKKHPVILLLAATLAMSACQKGKFHIEGTLTEAADSTLYLMHNGLDGYQNVDSVRLDSDGHFRFSGDAPEAPDFYVLRIGGQIINLSIDSTETVTVRASCPTMGTNYEVEGSDNCLKIKELALAQINLRQRILAIQQTPELGMEATIDSINRTVEAYKEDIKQRYIFPEPMKAYAYFALFQALGNQLIFNPRENKEDVKVFAAVATSWDTYYPGAVRGQNLHNIALEGMKTQRIVDAQNNLTLPADKVVVSNIIDIELPDNHGQLRRLSDLKGKVVLLDFHVFATKESTARIMQLREIYNKYHAQGLEIFQVSFDNDEHFWKQQTDALPWVSVRDAKGLESPYTVRYNLQVLPSYFLIDRTNSLYKRDAQMTDLEAEIRSLL